MFKKILGVCFTLLLASSVFGADAVGRVALVIGNAAYKSSPLANPVNDATDMAKSLRALGFDVVLRTNITSKQIGRTLRAFRTKIKPGDVALVFYAGHGLQINGENYLPAVDADIVGEDDVPNQSLSTRQILDVLADSKSSMNLVFLDACRDNPYARSFRSATRGLTRENAPSGTLMSFATRPGSVAADGTGRNGLYTSVLLKAMEEKNQPIEQVLKQVVRGVTAASNGAQEPWMEGSVTGDFCFGSCRTATIGTSAPAPSPTLRADELLWQSVQNSNDFEELSFYLKQYPNGIFAELAKLRITKIAEPNEVKDELKPPSSGTLNSAREQLKDKQEFSIDWPASGALISLFNEGKGEEKGISISGSRGDPVRTAASGRVVYSGSGLKGYGRLIIIKHNDTFLTSYAHNERLEVKEDQLVSAGQVIAHMGDSDSDRIKLYFEVRKLGKAVDPLEYLPNRASDAKSVKRD